MERAERYRFGVKLLALIQGAASFSDAGGTQSNCLINHLGEVSGELLGKGFVDFFFFDESLCVQLSFWVFFWDTLQRTLPAAQSVL